MRKIARALFLVYISLSCFSCKQIQHFSDQLFQTPSRKIYARNFDKNDLTFLQWQTAYDVAKQSSLRVSEPFVAQLVHQPIPYAYGYSLKLEQGEELVVQIDSPNQVFIEFYLLDDGGLSKKFYFNQFGENQFEKVIQESGWFHLILQPEIENHSASSVKIFTRPTLSFPVADATNNSIQSFWGAPRDGGARKHEGVDIFAPKGTNLLSVTEGTVFKTGDYGLGGKQVWIRDQSNGNALYYAHLDEILATKGQRVKKGDIVGTVGNTGNARTTPPHLHFGIYDNGSAVDPYPFIQLRNSPTMFEPNNTNKEVRTNSVVNLRNAPNTDSNILTQVSQQQTLKVLAWSKDWVQVETKDKETGFVSSSLVQ